MRLGWVARGRWARWHRVQEGKTITPEVVIVREGFPGLEDTPFELRELKQKRHS